MTPHQFIEKWQNVSLSERSACQQHFLDLCDLLGQPKPAEADPDGSWYTFERGVRKTEGGQGWADVWLRDNFGWEYKRKKKDLAAAYKQLLQYREDLQNPPLLIVCDLDRIEIHTNFTGTVKNVYRLSLGDLIEQKNIELLRRVFTEPQSFHPDQTTEAVTEKVAKHIGEIADGMRERGIPAHDAAHFLMKLMFSMFAEDIDLLQNNVFKRIVTSVAKPGAVNASKKLSQHLKNLFKAMADGGTFGTDEIFHFNGGLFADDVVFDLTIEEIETLDFVAGQDWSSVEPSVFGTLFERILDPDKRSQIGAHYTGRADIEMLLQPVVMQPLRQEWESVKSSCDELWSSLQVAKSKPTQKSANSSKRLRRVVTKLKFPEHSATSRKIRKTLSDFIHRLKSVTVLDPACGSGNFLYVALNLLLDLEKEVISYASRKGISLFPEVRPVQLLGLEINEYAQQLASVVIWIGYLQWMHDNGFTPQLDPVLEPFESIRRIDAILDLSDPNEPNEPNWPKAEFIVGNPPFLGGSRMWEELGRDYQQKLWATYDGRLPGFSDLCCYWFERARKEIARGNALRAGLLATQGIRGGANREVLHRIKESGDIFFAESDRDWVLDGATVHVSMIGFDNGATAERVLDGNNVTVINANLTSFADITDASILAANDGIAFIGTKKAGDFNIPIDLAVQWLRTPNPNGRPNADIVRPWRNGTAIVRRADEQWIVDTGTSMTMDECCLFEAPFQHILSNVKPDRDKNKRATRRERWWLHAETCPGMRVAVDPLHRYLATPRVAKHRLFVWLDPIVLCDDGIFVFARDDDYFFGVLHSYLHESWARAQGTQVRERESGFRYTPTSCFENFPFPQPTDSQRIAISHAAQELDTLRNNWLNPPEWTRTELLEFPGSTNGPWRRFIDLATSDRRGIATVRYPRTVPKDEECANQLKKRTLTNLYNERPTWLDLAHKKLDAAVFAAYGWDPAISDDDLLANLLALNLERASKQ